METGSIPWRGRILGVQPRIRLTRSFDERTHMYLGYVLRLEGTIGGQLGEYLVGIGPGAQAKRRFRAGDVVRGESQPAGEPRTEPADYYKTVRLELVERQIDVARAASPPWLGVPPELPEYRARGHRRLDAQTYEAKCRTCLWGCRMAVDMIVDPWRPRDDVRYRFETFCYGPKSCRLYRAGPRRKVPGRKGVTWEEPDWVDKEATEHRGPDE
ncbi:MAG TPA: hypothetical protein VJX92_04270 [Methylomirabilota bacterium]|nr:hypothetical protein [Methylomirabilota bacterium]